MFGSNLDCIGIHPSLKLDMVSKNWLLEKKIGEI
jgi:hypothetical protein